MRGSLRTQLVPEGEKMRVAIENIVQDAYSANDINAIYYSDQVQKDMLLGRLYVAKFLESNTEKDFEIAFSNIGSDLTTAIATLDENNQDTEISGNISQFQGANQKYLDAMNLLHGLILEKNHIQDGTLRVVGPKVAQLVDEIKNSMTQEQELLGNELKAESALSINITLISSIIAFVIGVTSAYLLTTTITRPILKAVDAANQLAHGNLNLHIGETANDETGLLLDAVQNTANNLKQMISTISGASSELASASEELAVVTERTSDGIVQQEQQTELVATAMNEMATTVHDVADNAARAADAANEADREALSGSKVVSQTILSINSLSDSVNHSSERLNLVQQQVLNISSILEVIKGIADQTNLLALNAAIEAARAGEQGRGFAVVADEVRSLAARTQGSTSEIQHIIEQLQAGTQSAVDVMLQGKTQADLCVEQANNTGSALEAITNAISIINDMNMQIASASEQQSSVAENINENVVNVKQIAEENSVAANQTRSTSAEIARLAEQLNQLVTEFRV
jgi:methyl-accepting chemotaxis protein